MAKDVTDYHLEKGITVSAGKDSSGNEQLYKINEDLVLNQAKVKELRTIFIEKETGNEIEENLKIKKIYARPVANSADGFGKPFTDPYPKWPTFGKGSFPENEPGNVCDTINVVHEAIERKDQLRIGFAIASPQLMLLGGKRMVTVSGLKQLISILSMPYSFEIWLTGEKGWIIIDQTIQDEEYLKLTKHIEYGIINPDSKIESSYYVGGDDILIYLPLSEKAIIPYNTKDHQDFDFKTKHPVMIIKLKSNLEISQKSFQELESKDIRLSTRVGSINPTFSDDKNYYSALKDEKDEKLFGYHFDGLNTLYWRMNLKYYLMINHLILLHPIHSRINLFLLEAMKYLIRLFPNSQLILKRYPGRMKI
ncbi:MAG: hypothetical protein IPP71_10380 [Bacteroidetes bacterium]|nr:hypothetical protein [Bacteroidota bacterium]